MLQIGQEPGCDMPTIITPNNDGVNDILVVPCLVLEGRVSPQPAVHL